MAYLLPNYGHSELQPYTNVNDLMEFLPTEEQQFALRNLDNLSVRRKAHLQVTEQNDVNWAQNVISSKEMYLLTPVDPKNELQVNDHAAVATDLIRLGQNPALQRPVRNAVLNAIDKVHGIFIGLRLNIRNAVENNRD